MVKVVLGLGSNMGDRKRYLNKAIELLAKYKIITELTISSILNTKAMLLPNSPKEWDKDYLNMAVLGETQLSPRKLLSKIEEVERELGKKKLGVWGPRNIDIDILAYGEEVYNDDKLIIPHKELIKREWALIPFKDIWPDWRYPIPGPYFQKTINQLIEAKK